jgi:predicted transcriptional regulator
MSKGFSGHFHGTLGTSVKNGSLGESYSDRKIEIPKHIQDNLSKLKKEGSYISGKLNSFPIEDVSIMSKETGVEFAKVTIGDKEILIRGSKKGAVIPDSIIDKIKKGKGTFDFHSHPYDNDNVPSQDDYDVMASIYHATGQKTSKIVTPNGRITVYSHRGVVEIGTVSNKIDDKHKKALLKLFGGK